MNRLSRAFLILIVPVVYLTLSLAPALALDVGEPAPDFELDSTQGGKLKLSSLQGKNVLVQFYVLDFSPG